MDFQNVFLQKKKKNKKNKNHIVFYIGTRLQFLHGLYWGKLVKNVMFGAFFIFFSGAFVFPHCFKYRKKAASKKKKKKKKKKKEKLYMENIAWG